MIKPQRAQIEWSTMPYSAGDFVDELNSYFWPPQKWDEEQAKNNSRRVSRAVTNYPDPVRRKAADNLINRAKDRRWPLINDVVAACEEMDRYYKVDKQQSKLPLLTSPGVGEWAPDRVKLADDILRSSLGRQAAKEGWAHPLWVWCRRKGEAPRGAEIDACKRAAMEHLGLVEEVVRGTFVGSDGVECKYNPTLRKALEDWGNEILVKEKERATFALMR